MKKILVLTGPFYPHVGGIASQLFESSKRLVEREYEIDIIACNTKNVLPHEIIEGINVYRLDSWNALGGMYPIPRPTRRNLRMLWTMLRKRHDLVQVYTRFYINSTLGVFFSRLKKIPLLYTELGSRHFVSSNKMVSLSSRIYDHTLGALLVKHASSVTVVTQATIPFLRHLGLKKEAVVIPSIIKNEFISYNNNLRQKLGIDGAVVISSVGRLIYAKGVQDLIQAFHRIQELLGRAEILIIGDGEYRRNLEALAKEIDGKHIHFLGWKDPQEVAEILATTDIMVSTSYSEALSTSILEACAIGLPIIATNIGGTPDVVKNYETGILFEPGDTQALADSICQVAMDRDLAKKMGNAAKKLFYEKFDWNNDDVVCEFCNIIDSVS